MKVIALVGIEGIGKTEIVDFLSNKYHAPQAIEYGSWYCQNVLNGYYDGETFLTTKKDYQIIICKQQEIWNQILVKKPRIAFFDTDLIFVKYFFDRQFEEKLFTESTLSKQPIDYYIFLKSDHILKKNDSILKYSTIKKETQILLSMYQKYVHKKLIIIEEKTILEMKQKILIFLKKIL